MVGLGCGSIPDLDGQRLVLAGSGVVGLTGRNSGGVGSSDDVVGVSPADNVAASDGRGDGGVERVSTALVVEAYLLGKLESKWLVLHQRSKISLALDAGGAAVRELAVVA